MKAFEILKKIITIIQKNLNVTIYNTFSPKAIKLPIAEKFLTIEIYSGSEDKILINLTAYTPQPQGAKLCTELIKKTIEILNSSEIESLTDILIQNVMFDKTKKAYIQKAKLTFKLPKEQKTKIVFGNEELNVNSDLNLKFARNFSIYYSQICGPKLRDLGATLRKVEGSAKVKNDQFQRLTDLIVFGKIKPLKIHNQCFNALLTSLERKTKDKITFCFLEVL